MGIADKWARASPTSSPATQVFLRQRLQRDDELEYTTVKSDCVVKLPDDTSDWASAVIEPNCCVVNLLQHHQHIQAGDHVVLVGAGYRAP